MTSIGDAKHRKALSGYKQKCAVARWCKRNGIRFFRNANGWPDRIHDALIETARVFTAWRAARDAGVNWSEGVRLRKRADVAVERSNALRMACRQAFADSRGWRWNRKAWTADLSEDARGAQEIADHAARRGYIAEKLPFSWWNSRFSGGCCCMVFTRKAGVNWPK
jgi:hypothetical protein